MILVAPDKFKGTLTAREATNIIADALAGHDCVRAPMADGGEGTASILCSGPQWDKHYLYYVNQHTRTAVIDSSAVIGLDSVNWAHHDILKASSAPLGLKVREILKGGCKRVVIGIGGTATCDGGEGFLVALGLDKLRTYRDCILGLSDVSVPLIAPAGQPSALMFAPQKGASDSDIEILRHRLEHIYRQHPGKRSPYDGAGGGLGFAIASVIGAKCVSGAKYVLDNYNIRWDDISLVITGEGRVDQQTQQGKVVSVISEAAHAHNIPVITFGGVVDDNLRSANVISTADYYPEQPLDSKTAAMRLHAAVSDFARGMSLKR